ncbi:MAG: bifunctional phosphopantothenoylcysteine decarboxylase/phosphopantothenate--cysteine ligase CoaBC [Actinobacteria bacterium]|nr:bifunctional phosphopantothenoylcysteine decarboxylase/phosphopantothenate--cysteine ligase CoaBC [Actinomycetota bacterium]
MQRRILLGVTGGIAAYKAVYLARRLGEEGADVQVVMTEAAQRFVGAQSFSAVTGHRVLTDLFGRVSPHTELAHWAEGVVVAPATATTIAKAAAGLGDDLLSATLLATRSPVLFAPAMHTEMWENAATRRNVSTLMTDGYRFVGPASGALAGGDSGPGRMVEPEEIVTALSAMLNPELAGWDVLVTAGGTREPIDPVRFLGNRSTGKMGHAIAAEAARRGARVTLISTSALETPPGVDRVTVETADEMAEAVLERASRVDAVVMAAAVADFKPAQISDRKLRRKEGPPMLELTKTPDILAAVAALETRPFLVGFAAETGPVDAAIEKARDKGADFIVANDVSAQGSGFGTETNQVSILDPDGAIDTWPLMSKQEVAVRLWDVIVERAKPLLRR